MSNPELGLIVARVRQAREKLSAWARKAMDMEAAGIPNQHTSAEESLLIVEGLTRAEMVLTELDRLENGDGLPRTG